LKIVHRTLINAVQREAGTTIDIHDPGLIDGLIESGVAIPLDPVQRQLWLDGLPRRTPWVQRLRR
jgi:hypothetical protein